MLEPLPASFVATREAMHALAEHVLSPARYRVDGHIGLVATPGGFGTPVFGDGERVRVEGVELVHERPGTVTRVGLTNLGTAAQFVGVPLGEAADVYTPKTPCGPEVSIVPDPDSARVLAAWIALGDSLLSDLRVTYSALEPSPLILWPEHFDLACEFGDEQAGSRANYGACPGDSVIPEPYLYVSPWEASRRTGALGTHGFGTAVTYGELTAGGDARGAGLDFLLEGAALVHGQP